MSRAIASARQRRAGLTSTEPAPTSTPAPSVNNPTQGLTLHQVINLVDIRLIKLEKFMADNQNQIQSQLQSQSQNQTQNQISEKESDNSVPELLDEFEHRFELLATEIENIKDIVLKLQSYTMEVNRKLLEDKDILDTTDSKTVFTMHNLESTNDLMSSFDMNNLQMNHDNMNDDNK